MKTNNALIPSDWMRQTAAYRRFADFDPIVEDLPSPYTGRSWSCNGPYFLCY